MRKSFNFLFCFFVLAISLAGCRSFNYRVAENYYTQYAYAKAIPKYEKVLKKGFAPDAASKLAESYRKTGNSPSAEIWYKRLVSNPQVTLQNKLDLAEVLMENGKCSEAKIWFQEYLLLNSTDKRVKRMIQACDSVHLFFQDTSVYTVSYLKLNKDLESNFSPSYFRDGIVFLSDRPAPGKNAVRSEWTGKEYLDLFYTRKDGSGNWVEPELLKGDINGLYDEGPAAFSKDNTTIYFTRNDYNGKNVETNQRDESNLKLYNGKLIGNVWKLEGPMTFNNADYSVGHPSLSADGKSLYFVSDMPWGYGGTDIYISQYDNGYWSEPSNLGASVNTEGDEMFPFISTDSVIYFASDGHIGLGGLDIFSTAWNGVKWSEPENLQYPVNSSKDDFGFIIDSSNTAGYFSSNRSKNIDKLYGFSKNPPVFSYNLTAFDAKNKKALPAFTVSTISKNSKPKILITGKSGLAEMPLASNTVYDVLIKSPGYYGRKISFSTVGKRKSEIIADSVALDKIEVNKAIIWPTINFPKKETEVKGTTARALDSLATILDLNPEIQIEITSHTDSRGAFPDNLNISKKRSDEIALYLINKGINAPRLVSVGYGESKLLNYCKDGILCLEEDHRINNRVEIKVVGLMK